MGLLETGGLALAFAAVADLMITGGAAISSIYSLAAEGSAGLVNAMDIPQLDLFSLMGGETATQATIAADPCLASGGHYHGSLCHYGGDIPFSSSPAVDNGVLKLK